MGDKVGRVYVDRQDLSTLQARKFKGLKRAPPQKGEAEVDAADEGEGEAGPSEERKRVRTE